MSSKIKGIIILGIVAIIMVLPMILYKNQKDIIDVITFDEYKELTDNADFTAVFFGDTDASEYNDIKKNLVRLQHEHDITTIYAVNYNTLTTEQKLELTEIFESEAAFVFIKNGKIVHIEEGQLDSNRVERMFSRLMTDALTPTEVKYIEVEKADDYLEAIKGRNNIIMTVYGRDTCMYCTMFEPIYNTVAEEYGIDIYLVSSSRMDPAEYEKIASSDIMIPPSCSSNGSESSLQNYGTPLTLFTKDGISFDCIGGYVEREALITKLQEVGIIED